MAAAAAPDTTVQLTNLPWQVSARAVSARLGGVPVALVNDLAAVAHALPGLGPRDVAHLHPGAAADPGAPGWPEGPRLAVNLGTGFGAALALPLATGWTVLPTEPGHIGLLPATEAEAALLAPGDTVETWLSGPGLARMRARLGEAEARRVLSSLLGRVMGDLALATGAWGGLFLCGGVGRGIDGIADTAALLAAMHRPHPLAARLAAVPVARITTAEPALAGLSAVPL